VYIKNVEKVDPEQERFLQEVQDFSKGYFRHEMFTNCNQLAEQVRRDIITWTTRQVRKALSKELEVERLRDKVAYLSRTMERYGIPEDLR
jgi:hypothetical protein